MPNLHIYKNEKETCLAFAQWLSDLIAATLQKQDLFTIALSAAAMPKTLYKILGSEYFDKIDWEKTHWFLTDSIMTASSEPGESHVNSLTNLLDQLPVSKDKIHLIRTDVTPEEAAGHYQKLLQSYFKGSITTFDVAFLGMDERGRLLTLLPYSVGLNSEAFAIHVYDETEDQYKITLTISSINASAAIVFLLTGKAKEEVVQKVLKGKYEPEKYPAQLINTVNKNLHWFLDEGAANKLIKPLS